MYVIPIVAVVVLALIAVAWSPIFALIFFAIFMVGFFAFIGISRRPDQKMVPHQRPGNDVTPAADEDAGLWGERRPE